MKDIAKALAMLSQIGISMFVPIFLSMMIGISLDKFFDASPLFLAVFIILGVGAAFRTLYMMTKKYAEDDEKKNKK